MKRNCNLELRLERPSQFLRLSDHEKNCPIPTTKFQRTYCTNDDHRDMMGKEQGDKQQLTIFYNGNIVVCDATELQARAIIWLASREADSNESPQFEPPSPLVASPLYSPTTGLKRSLVRFLRTRKTRVQANSPYPLTRNQSN